MATYRFGAFSLTEESRTLTCSGVELAMQPRVFDFLTLLIRNRSRVVAKDELISALWPDVTVTEASLQRLASLARTSLRRGGMEGAIRSFARIGYRFCEPVEREAAGEMPDERQSVGADVPVATALAFLEQHLWTKAADAFEGADKLTRLDGADLERWAHALECIGRPDKALEVLRRAIVAHDMQGAGMSAANVAITMSKIHLERFEMAAAKGWLSRAARLMGDDVSSREFGLFCWMQARVAAVEGEPERALELCERAYQTGIELRDPALEALGLIFRGFYKLCLGNTESGLEDQDHAAALALSSGIDPVTGYTVYCNILWACRNFGDWERASQWTPGYQKWCSECGIDRFTGSCQLHLAELAGVRGAFVEAEERVVEALDSLASDAPWALGDANRVLGDIHRMRGDLDKAERAYEVSCAAGWDPQPGLALLQFEKGDSAAALSGLERALVGRAWPTLQRKGLLLSYLALIAARDGRVEHAQSTIEELELDPVRWSTPSILAVTAEAKAELLCSAKEIAAALQQLEIARRLWLDVGASYNVAETRLRMAELLLDQNNDAAAQVEIKAARTITESLAATRLIRRSEELSSRLTKSTRSVA